MPRSCSPSARAFAVLLASSGLLLACTSIVPRFHLAEDAPSSREISRVVLLPMNFDQTPRPSLAQGTEAMGERIRSHLEASGFQVVVPRMSETLELWKKSVAEVGGITDESGKLIDEERYGRARSALVRDTLAANPADAVVAASILLREARYSGMNLSWDGALRPVDLDMGNSNLPALDLRGKDLGVSLRTSVFDREGRSFFERYVGLEPLRRFRVVNLRVESQERPDLFQNEALLQASIDLSFQPWLDSAPVAAD